MKEQTRFIAEVAFSVKRVHDRVRGKLRGTLSLSPLMRVRVRLAPSPTGPLHVGTARTALFNYLFARQHGGQFVLRIEDTDAARSRPEYEQEILEELRWLGLSWDEGPDVSGPHAPYRQSERAPHYNAAIEKLLREGKAREEAGAVTFLVNVVEPLVVRDLIRGDVQFPVTELTDFVIAKSSAGGEGPTSPSRLRGAGKPARRSSTSEGGYIPLFHLAVVVDDAAMEITHVIRGEDHLSNTPRHILLQRALGLPTPQYAHVPLLLDPERKKLSKRTFASGATLDVRLLAYRDAGYLPEAIVNFIALLGWNPKTTDEVFTREQLVERFQLEGIQKGGAIFDLKKLDWLQQQHLKRQDLGQLRKHAQPFLESVSVQNPDRSLEVWREHGLLLRELPEALAVEAQPPQLVREDVPWRGVSEEKTRESLRFAEKMIEGLPPAAWETRDGLQLAFRNDVDAAGWDRGTVLWPLRYVLSGKRESAGPGELAWLLGKEETLRRIQKAVELLK